VEARYSSPLVRVCCNYIAGLSLVKISTYCRDSSLLVCSSEYNLLMVILYWQGYSLLRKVCWVFSPCEEGFPRINLCVFLCLFIFQYMIIEC
jgi:hypothetical protein